MLVRVISGGIYADIDGTIIGDVGVFCHWLVDWEIDLAQR